MISAALRVKQTMKERTEGSVAGLGRRLDIPSAPPVMQLRSKNFCRNSPRPATSPTPEQADSAFSKLLGFSSGRTQNPPVLWLTESACSCPEQPLSATHGRQRYNTLDFANKVVCHETAGFFGFFLPRRVLPSIGFLPPRQRRRLWKPLPRKRCPLWISQPTGRSRPYWKPRAKGTAVPLESQPVLK